MSAKRPLEAPTDGAKKNEREAADDGSDSDSDNDVSIKRLRIPIAAGPARDDVLSRMHAHDRDARIRFRPHYYVVDGYRYPPSVTGLKERFFSPFMSDEVLTKNMPKWLMDS